ncbi:hypothetical protein [Geomonas propionica]|uniref:Uncharacterized protein n=1 Tax=Geomonas propionica TaxID=2798582 RepID=A0ABS0YP36_9BACT|nr:hypothetical protein [Geomonas propionica]MBJ6799714.1 hypothetical protein [Geomonas propionica]
MATLKFDEADRRNVIAEVERCYKVKLMPVGNYRKYLRDQTGRTFWVFGGYDDWHGIPSKMIKAEEGQSGNGVLIVAKRYGSRIDVYSGALSPLIQNKKSLCLTKQGDYQFNIRIRGNGLTIHEVPTLHLSKLSESQFTTEEKATEKAVTIIRKLPRAAKEQVLAALLRK